MLAQGVRAAYDSVERGWVDLARIENESRRNSLLLQQPGHEQGREARYEQERKPYYGQGREPHYEPGREPHSEHVHETGEYTRESRAILQPVSRQPASRQSVSKQNANRQQADQQPENRQNVNFAKAEKPKRRRGNLPKVVTDLLRQWFSEHIAHPYPTVYEKQRLMRDTGLNMSQVC